MSSKLEKYLNENIVIIEGSKWKHMGDANDGMANFLGELEGRVDFADDDRFNKLMGQIDGDWDKLWSKITGLARKV